MTAFIYTNKIITFLALICFLERCYFGKEASVALPWNHKHKCYHKWYPKKLDEARDKPYCMQQQR